MLKEQLTVPRWQVTIYLLAGGGDAVPSRTNIQLILAKYRLLCPALARGAQDTRVTALSPVSRVTRVVTPRDAPQPPYMPQLPR